MLHEIQKDLHNRVIQLCGNIRVFVRVRPLVDSESASFQKQAARTMGGRPSSHGRTLMQQRRRKLAAEQRAADACVRGIPLLVDSLDCRPWLITIHD